MNYLERRECSQKIYAPHKFFYIFSLKLNLSFLVSHEADYITIQQATKRAHPRKSLPVYLKEQVGHNYIIFAQKYYDSTTLSMSVDYTVRVYKFNCV